MNTAGDLSQKTLQVAINDKGTNTSPVIMPEPRAFYPTRTSDVDWHEPQFLRGSCYEVCSTIFLTLSVWITSFPACLVNK